MTSSALIDLNFGMLYAPHTLGACLPLCEVSQKSMRGISRYLGFSKKRVFLKKGLVALSNLSKIWLCCRGGGSNQAR